MARDGNTVGKTVQVKFVGSNRKGETIQVGPGATTRDVLKELRLGTGGFQLSDARKPEVVFAPDDIVYARVEDGDLIYCSAVVSAGLDWHYAFTGKRDPNRPQSSHWSSHLPASMVGANWVMW